MQADARATTMRMTPLVDLLVLDLAGTTVVDDDHVRRSLLAAARAFDLHVEPAALQSRMGWHKVKVFASLLAEAGRDIGPAEQMARRFEHEFAALVAKEPLRPTNGAVDAIAALERAGVHVAFSTGFSRATADVVLAAMGWQRFVSVASDEVVNGRPAPELIERAMQLTDVADARRVGVVGDTPVDLLAGEAAGVAVIVGVGCGTHTLEQLRPHPHTHLLDDLTELAGLVLGG